MIQIRPILEPTSAVAPLIFDILCDVYVTSPWTLAQIQTDLAQPHHRYWLAYAGDQLVGFLAVQDLGQELELLNIAVKTTYQGQGVASQLMRVLDEFDQPIFLEVRASNQPAQALYQKYGFEKIGQRKNYYHDPIEDAWVMQRKGVE